jgi:hypothetical protein
MRDNRDYYDEYDSNPDDEDLSDIPWIDKVMWRQGAH